MIASALVHLVRLYQLTLSRLIRLFFGPICRFEPSCSQYAVLCLRSHGAARGSYLAAKRICRCNPFFPGGYDPPPPVRPAKAAAGESDQEPDARR